MNRLIVLSLLAVGLGVPGFAKGSFRITHSGSVKGPSMLLKDRTQMCTSNFPKGFSIICELDTSSVQFFINDKASRIERVKPFTIGGDEDGIIKKWRHYPMGLTEIECRSRSSSKTISITINITKRCEKPLSVPVLKMMKSIKKPIPTVPFRSPDSNKKPYRSNSTPTSSNCIVKRATQFYGGLPYGWTLTGKNALTYRDGDNFGGVDGANKAVLRYRFKVPLKSHYGVTLDMETNGYTEHNDVFVACSGGLRFRQYNKHFTSSAPAKVYHNDKGRATKAFHKDHDPHTMSTAKVYEPGKIYECSISGRSTKTTIHALILFPCNGTQCDSWASHWKWYLHKCHV